MSTATPISKTSKESIKHSSPITNVPLLDVQRGNGPLRQALLESVARVLDSGRFLHGAEVTSLENSIADFAKPSTPSAAPRVATRCC